MEFIQKLFDTSGFMPHGHCYLWTPILVYMNVISDGLIFAAYLAISISLILLKTKVKEIPYQSIYAAFGLFIIACGVTHLMEIINVWIPAYWAAVSIKIGTAVASVGTACLLPFYFRKARDLARGALLYKTQEALRKSEMLYRQIVDTANEGIWLLDLDNKNKFVNRRMAEILGFTVEEMMGCSLSDFMDFAEIKKFEELRGKHMEGAIENNIFKMRHKDGSEVWTDVACNPILDANGKISSSLGMVTDITKKRMAEEQLRLSEIHYRSLVDAVPQLVWSHLIDGRADYSNPNLIEHLGFSPHYVIRELLELIHPDEREATNRLWDDAFHREQAIDCEFRLLRHDGVYRWQLSRIIPLRDELGTLIKWIGIATDIHEQKEDRRLIIESKIAQNQHRIREASAQEASRLKSEFLAHMSHEIRTPLNGLIGMVHLISDTALNAEQREYIENALRSGDTLMTVVNDILDLSKIEAGKLDFEIIDFDLFELIEDTQKDLFYAARNKGLRLYSEIDTEVPRYVQADPGRLRQVLTNLLSNALKFTEFGSIHLRLQKLTREGVEFLQFEVIDSGIGISKEGMGKLFSAFSQADSSTTRRFGGTGLGLAISKNLVERMDGQIGAESTEGAGSRFWFTIRLKEGEPVRPSVQLQSPVRQETGANILVADDNLINRKVILKFLDSLGYRAQAVSNGLDVLRALGEQSYHLILMDCHMPEMDGYECTKSIRESGEAYRDIPIVALTASAMKKDQDRVFDAGMNAHITKPLKKDILSEVLQGLLIPTRISQT